MSSPLCLLFDCDGTLVDSEPLLATEMATALSGIGLPFLASDYMGEFRGTRFRHIVAELQSRYGPVDPDHLEAMEGEMRRRLMHRLETELVPLPGVFEALAALYGHPMAVVSNGAEAKVRTSLASSGLDECFGDRIVSGYTARCWKPDPSLFLYAARMMDRAPWDCVAIDDSLVGVRAALAAGMTVIHLNRFPDVEETPGGAIMISSMYQLPTIIFGLERARNMAVLAY
jgi:HAD superfamily hydrolase (TIGR01509 family)